MWSDNDIDNAFRRLNPPEPEPASFPMDAWLRLETQLDKAVIERAVRRKLLRFLVAEVAIVAMLALGWLLWPNTTAARKEAAGAAVATSNAAVATTSPANARPANGTARMAKRPSLAVATNELAALAKAATTVSPAPPPTAAPATAAVTAPRAATKPTALAREGMTRAMISVEPRRHPQETQRPAERGASRNGVSMGSSASGSRRRFQKRGERNALSTSTRTASPSFVSAGNKPTYAPQSATAPGRDAQAVSSSSATLPQPDLGVERAAPARETSRSAAEATEATEETSENPTGLEAIAGVAVPVQPTAAPELPATLPAAALTDRPALPVLVRQPRLYIGVMGAPDVSTVKFAGIHAPLLNLGVTLEYRLTNRLRLATGILRSTKQYVARRDDYNWGAYKQLVYSNDFKNVDGTCTVLDVPLNLRYDFVFQPQYRVFGSLGLSSFFMQREVYSYDYWENSVLKQFRFEPDKKNQHLLSILNLSAGYERRFGPRWSVQAEPYVKVPLAGVGAGKVRLTSGGVSFGLKYGL